MDRVTIVVEKFARPASIARRHAAPSSAGAPGRDRRPAGRTAAPPRPGRAARRASSAQSVEPLAEPPAPRARSRSRRSCSFSTCARAGGHPLRGLPGMAPDPLDESCRSPARGRDGYPPVRPHRHAPPSSDTSLLRGVMDPELAVPAPRRCPRDLPAQRRSGRDRGRGTSARRPGSSAAFFTTRLASWRQSSESGSGSAARRGERVAAFRSISAPFPRHRPVILERLRQAIRQLVRPHRPLRQRRDALGDLPASGGVEGMDPEMPRLRVMSLPVPPQRREVAVERERALDLPGRFRQRLRGDRREGWGRPRSPSQPRAASTARSPASPADPRCGPAAPSPASGPALRPAPPASDKRSRASRSAASRSRASASSRSRAACCSRSRSCSCRRRSSSRRRCASASRQRRSSSRRRRSAISPGAD